MWHKQHAEPCRIVCCSCCCWCSLPTLPSQQQRPQQLMAISNFRKLLSTNRQAFASVCECVSAHLPRLLLPLFLADSKQHISWRLLHVACGFVSIRFVLLLLRLFPFTSFRRFRALRWTCKVRFAVARSSLVLKKKLAGQHKLNRALTASVGLFTYLSQFAVCGRLRGTLIFRGIRQKLKTKTFQRYSKLFFKY